MSPWRVRGRHDRRVLAIGAIIAGLLLGWALLWQPLRAARAELRERVAANADLLAAARDLPPSARPAGATRGGSLLARVDASARAAGLGDQIGGIEPQGPGALRLQLDGVAFDALAAWLQALAGEGFRVDAVSAQRAAGEGRVDARIVLRDAGA